ncbi:sugar porter family MFS transporter [Kocuria coralli]|uniref:Sugar porter family MFS transporter n=1 Tax=Kocuria coralli TaxID=1461025 RepID=A0A5J5KUT1_9MICC|nr:sugar porter family MFS transporter [Kocuria coralli]KAA9392980.1 sugar porter family MFS transporter [Kocuria coralli]
MSTYTSPTSVAGHTANTGAVLRITMVAALGGFLFGYDSAVINGATGAMREYFDVGATALGSAVASALLGAALGAALGGRLADKLGRVRVMRIAAVLFLISSIFCAIDPFFGADTGGFAWLVAWRVIGGVGVGVASIIAPAYIAEVAPADIRGRLGSLQQMGIVLGIFASQIANRVIVAMAGSSDASWLFGLDAWRWMFLLEAVPAIIYLIGAYTIPESPRWLVAQGRRDEAMAIMTKLQGEGPAVHRLSVIDRTLDKEHKPRFKDLAGKAFGLKPVMWVGIGVAALQQLVGINVIFYYSNQLWQSVGFQEGDAFTISTITSVTNVVVTVAAIMLVDKIGRKRLLLIGSIGMAITLGTMAGVFATATVTDSGPVLGDAAGMVALVAANLYVIFFGISWGPVMWVLLGEMFPNKIRGAALAVAGFVQWMANWLVTVTFPAISEVSLVFAYGLYAFFAFISIFFVIKVVRETKGMELEDMQN